MKCAHDLFLQRTCKRNQTTACAGLWASVRRSARTAAPSSARTRTARSCAGPRACAPTRQSAPASLPPAPSRSRARRYGGAVGGVCWPFVRPPQPRNLLPPAHIFFPIVYGSHLCTSSALLSSSDGVVHVVQPRGIDWGASQKPYCLPGRCLVLLAGFRFLTGLSFPRFPPPPLHRRTLATVGRTCAALTGRATARSPCAARTTLCRAKSRARSAKSRASSVWSGPLSHVRCVWCRMMHRLAVDPALRPAFLVLFLFLLVSCYPATASTLHGAYFYPEAKQTKRSWRCSSE